MKKNIQTQLSDALTTLATQHGKDSWTINEVLHAQIITSHPRWTKELESYLAQLKEDVAYYKTRLSFRDGYQTSQIEKDARLCIKLLEEFKTQLKLKTEPTPTRTPSMRV